MRILLILFGCFLLQVEPGFKRDQMQYPRVRTAYHDKYAGVEKSLEKAGIDSGSLEIFIRIFKKEKLLELWGKSKTMQQFVLLRNFAICSSSGELGPKRREGDRQVPEGYYKIILFNPSSNFLLSLGIDYPNAADRILASKERPGGNIFIHGSCVTIGCIPITDEGIKELYVYAVEARNSGQSEIQVQIFPSRLAGESWNQLQRSYEGNEVLLYFWSNLKIGYDYFETNKQIPLIETSSNGQYKFKIP
jgi:murein L,D-transpeptidase YafK